VDALGGNILEIRRETYDVIPDLFPSRIITRVKVMITSQARAEALWREVIL
jgi:hypothetical protein